MRILLVEDDGPGLPAAERARVLERFHRAPGGPGDGCGLGFSIVKEIADRHHGTITFHDGGSGLLVRIDLPLAADVRRAAQ